VKVEHRSIVLWTHSFVRAAVLLVRRKWLDTWWLWGRRNKTVIGILSKSASDETRGRSRNDDLQYITGFQSKVVN